MTHHTVTTSDGQEDGVYNIIIIPLSSYWRYRVTSCDPIVHVVMVTTAVKIIGGDFVFGYIQAIDGEKVSPILC